MKTKTEHKSKDTMTKQKWQAIGRSGFFFATAGALAAVAVIGLWVLAIIGRAPELDPRLLVGANQSLIFDQNDEMLAELEGVDGVRREWVDLTDISPVMIDAILAVEDARFNNHYGVDWTRTVAALLSNVEAQVGGGGGMQGGSTLTQQLINQTHLLVEGEDGRMERDNSVSRKIQEIYLSMQLEREFSKDQILEAYLNFSPFGPNVYGIQAAAEFYFNTNASELTLAQAATLAGILQAPSQWNPDANPHQTQIRRDVVLELMYIHGYIDENMRALAAAVPITDLLVENEVQTAEMERYDPFISHVLNEAVRRFDIEPHAGYRIYTTLDRNAQAHIHDMLTTNNHFHWPDDYIQTGVAMIDTQTGEIRALGSRNLMGSNEGARGFSMATDLQRQSGSASKPIWAYGAAMEYLNWGTGSNIWDDLYAGHGGHIFHNWDREIRGRVTLNYAMEWSWNVPAVRALDAVVAQYGEEHLADFVTRLGIPETAETIVQASALGGGTLVSPLQMAGAYATFGNGGTFNEPHAIRRIVAPDGEVLYESPHSERVVSEATAFMMTDTLRNVIVNGTGSNAAVQGQFVVGKTGTSNFDEATRAHYNIPNGAARDSWFVGYSSQYTVAIWTGYDNHRDGRFMVGFEAARVPHHLFRITMSELNTTGWNPPTVPPGVIYAAVERYSGTEDGESCSPTASTPQGLRTSGFFFAGHGPSCVSDTFDSPDAPENFRVSGSGSTFNFSWDPSENSISLDAANAAIQVGRSLRIGATHWTAAMGNLDPTEAEAIIMRQRIMASGNDIEYRIYGTLADGSSRLIAATTETEYDHTPSRLSEVATIRSFHVVACFEGGRSCSDPSNVVNNDGLIEMETSVPNMTGWTLTRAREWADERDIEVEYTQEYSDTVEGGQIISTSPSAGRSIGPGDTLNVVISRGPEEGTAPTRGPTGPTIPTGDVPVDNPVAPSPGLPPIPPRPNNRRFL